MTKKKQRNKEEAPNKTLTPYQGNKRAFGLFKCECERRWASAHTWKDCAQQCLQCKKFVYPFTQRRVQKKKPVNPTENIINKEHKVELCEKCIKCGFNCSRLYIRESKKIVENKKPQEKVKKEKKVDNKKKENTLVKAAEKKQD